MRWQRDRIVGSRSSALDDTSTMTVRAGGSSSVFSIALAATAGGTAQLLGLEQHQHLAFTLDRAAVRLGDHLLADVVDLVRRAARLELDDVGMHAARREAFGALVAGADESRRELAGRVFDAGASRPDEQVGVRRPLGRAFERVERTLLPDHAGGHGAQVTCRQSVGATTAQTRCRDLVAACRARRRAASPVPPPARGTPPAPRRGSRPRPAPSGRASAATRLLATSSGRSSTTTRSGSSSPAANALKRSTASTPSPRPTPWYASVDGVKRSLTTTVARGERGADDLGDVLRPVREHQQRARSRASSSQSACSSRSADLLAHARVARARA